MDEEINVHHDASITHISLLDVDELVENFCFSWSTREKTYKKWKQYYEEHQKKNRTVAIIKLNGDIVGYGSLLYKSKYPFFAEIPEINDIWIHEKHRLMGLATTLILWFEALAINKGFKKVGIGVGLYADYGGAQKLYTKLGYVPDGNGITYQYKKTIPGTLYPVDDELILWLQKFLQ